MIDQLNFEYVLSVETWCLTDSISIQTKTSHVFPEPFDIYVHSIQQWQVLGRLRVVPLFCFVCRARREKATVRKTSGRAPVTPGISRGHFIPAVFFRSSLDRVSERGAAFSLNYVCLGHSSETIGHKISIACAKRPQGKDISTWNRSMLWKLGYLRFFLFLKPYFTCLYRTRGGRGTPRNYG